MITRYSTADSGLGGAPTGAKGAWVGSGAAAPYGNPPKLRTKENKKIRLKRQRT